MRLDLGRCRVTLSVLGGVRVTQPCRLGARLVATLSCLYGHRRALSPRRQCGRRARGQPPTETPTEASSEQRCGESL